MICRRKILRASFSDEVSVLEIIFTNAINAPPRFWYGNKGVRYRCLSFSDLNTPIVSSIDINIVILEITYRGWDIPLLKTKNHI